MILADFLPIFIQIVLAIGMGVGILVASHIFGQRATRSKIKDSPYECGMSSEVSGTNRYSVKFYVTAMLFILFDIDGTLLTTGGAGMKAFHSAIENNYPSQLKKCGLSRQKVLGIQSLAKQIINKSFNPKLINKMNDEDAINYLSNLRQIGRWSAEMILLFTYNRSNIWPIQDIGLLRAISKNYKKKYLPPESYVNLLNKRFSPYCSVATWYLWRSIDPEPIQY